MCTTSFIILRKTHDKAAIREKLSTFCASVNCGVNFDASDILPELPFISIGEDDVAFEIYDKHFLKTAGVFMSFEPLFDAEPKPRIPLRACFVIMQHAIATCLPYAQFAEVYITNSHAAEDDFTELSISTNKLGDLLNAEYAKVPLWCPFVPDLHLLIDRTAEDTATHEKAETILHSGGMKNDGIL